MFIALAQIRKEVINLINSSSQEDEITLIYLSCVVFNVTINSVHRRRVFYPLRACQLERTPLNGSISGAFVNSAVFSRDL